MDVCKIRPGVYQYTAIDDCSRYKVLGVFTRRTAADTLRFFEQVIEEMPFAIQRIQTDRGLEFFAEAVQRRLFDWGIKSRPIRPRSPHLKGKVVCCQSDDNASPIGAKIPETGWPQAAGFCHSGRAAKWRVL